MNGTSCDDDAGGDEDDNKVYQKEVSVHRSVNGTSCGDDGGDDDDDNEDISNEVPFTDL